MISNNQLFFSNTVHANTLDRNNNTPRLQTHSSRSVCCDAVLFLWMSRGFFWFSAQSSKNLEKTKKNQTNQKVQPYVPIGSGSFVFFLVFCFFEVFFGFLPKVAKTSRKQKNQTNQKVQPYVPIGSGSFVFFWFFVFSRFFWVSAQSSKNLEKTKKKTKKPKSTTLCAHWVW